MTKKEQLYYLLNGLSHGEIEINNFTIQFMKIFDLEIDYDELSFLGIYLICQVGFLIVKKI